MHPNMPKLQKERYGHEEMKKDLEDKNTRCMTDMPHLCSNTSWELQQLLFTAHRSVTLQIQFADSSAFFLKTQAK